MEKPPSPEAIEQEIERLLGELDAFALDQFPQEVQDELADAWYEAEMQARVGKDRNQGLADLQKFLERLRNTLKKEA